jgi:VWFA-related protein
MVEMAVRAVTAAAVGLNLWLAAALPARATTPAAQPARPDAGALLTVVRPKPEDVIVGATEFEATIPAGLRLARLEFFVDGVLACTLTATPLTCSWDAGSEIRSRVVRAVATLESGQRVTETVKTSAIEARYELVDVRAVLVPTVVTDRNGRFVEGLTQTDFKMFENDRPVAISLFQAENAPLSVVLTLDLSESMRRALPEVRNAIRRFVTALRPTDHVTILGFNERMYVLTEGPRDTALAGAALDGLTAGGSTALYDAIVYAINRSAESRGRHAVVVVSDGADMSSQAEYDAVERFIQSSDATLYAITVGAGAKSRYVRSIMARLAERSGGRAFSGSGVSDVVEALEFVRDDLAHQYLLAYSPEGNAAKNAPRRIKVVAGNGLYRVRTRSGNTPSRESPPTR